MVELVSELVRRARRAPHTIPAWAYLRLCTIQQDHGNFGRGAVSGVGKKAQSPHCGMCREVQPEGGARISSAIPAPFCVPCFGIKVCTGGSQQPETSGAGKRRGSVVCA